MEEHTIPLKPSEGFRRSIQFRSASVVSPLNSMRKVCAGNEVLQGAIKLDVNRPGLHDRHEGLP